MYPLRSPLIMLPRRSFRMNEQLSDYSHPRYDRFRDMPFSRIIDKHGNDVTRERMLPKTLRECQICGIVIQVIIEDLDQGIAYLRCRICRKEADDLSD